MYLLYLILILLSLVGLGFLLGTKISEIKSGKVSILAGVSLSTDPLIREKIEAGKEMVVRFNKSNFEKFFRVALLSIFHLFGTAGLFVSKYYKKFMARVRGKKALRTGGVVSFFLKNVAESRGEDEEKKL